MEIQIEPIPEEQRATPIADASHLPFGKYFTDYMFVWESHSGVWGTPTIKKLENFSLHPGAVVLHYAQEIFEGMKAYKHADGTITLFRPEENIRRFNRSADRMCIPQVDPEVFMNALKALVRLEERHIPTQPGTSLYIRPFIIGTDAALGVHAAIDYIFCIICSPVGPYYPHGFHAGKYFVTSRFSRAAPGGTGNVKCGGNYAASMFAGELAKQKHCSQVLWLDPVHHKYVEEVGAMNMFFLMDGKAYTAPLTTGTILPGITRASVIQLLTEMGIEVVERALSIDEIMESAHNGTLTEAFGTGTAAVISPVGELLYEASLGDERPIRFGEGEVGPISQRLYKTLSEIHYGIGPDPHHWNVIVP